MAKPPYLEEDCMKHYKANDHIHTYKSNSYLSFLASLFSLFIYISIFYIFNLSPYTLFNSNIFWFFMSNTLILIIAADYGAFSSSKQKHDLYEDYVKHSQARNHVTPSSRVPRYEQQVDKQCINPKQELGGKLLHEKKETLTEDQNSEIIPERVLEIVAQNEPKKPSECSNEKKQKPVLLLKADEDGYKEFEEEKAKPARINYGRSKSDRFHGSVKGVVVDERKNSTVRRSETMKQVEAAKVEEENEFSKMTNEDLNRRAEEFIQKFNRQIRLQAATRN